MKIACLVIPIVLCVLLIILPIFELVAIVNDLNFDVYSNLVMPIIQTVFAVGSAVAIYIMKPEYGITGKIFCSLLTPIALLNALCFVDCGSIPTIVLAVVWTCAVFAIYLRFVPDSFLKAASSVVSVLLTIAFVVFFLLIYLKGAVMESRVVDSTIESPDGEITAEIATKKAILSEKMEVTVHCVEPKTRAFFGSYSYKDYVIYEGDKAEVHTAVIEWKDDTTLLINDKEYKIDFEKGE